MPTDNEKPVNYPRDVGGNPKIAEGALRWNTNPMESVMLTRLNHAKVGGLEFIFEPWRKP
jgi:hypothetical protein